MLALVSKKLLLLEQKGIESLMDIAETQSLKIMYHLPAAKINNILMGNVKNLDVVMPLYNLIEYSKNCKDSRQPVELLWR